MEEKNNLPAKLSLAPQQLTEPVIKAFFNTELVRREYHKILQGVQNTNPTKENLLAAQTVLKAGDKFLSDIEKLRKSVSDPYKDAQKLIIKTLDNLLAPISTELETLRTGIKIIDAQVSADLEETRKENERIKTIQDYMTTFINNSTVFITTAPTDKAIANLQKRIGTEKSRVGFYQEFIAEFRNKCDALTPLINKRKEVIRKGNELLIRQQEAIQSGDTEKATEIKEQLEGLDTEMEENALRMQEEAFSQATSNEVVVGEPMMEAAKGRQMWRWEVENIELLYKKMPALIQLEPNKEAIDKYLSDNKEQWVKDNKKEVVVHGLKFFIKKFI